MINFGKNYNISSRAEKAVIWLCGQVKKPILRLVEDDYEDHGLTELVM